MDVFPGSGSTLSGRAWFAIGMLGTQVLGSGYVRRKFFTSNKIILVKIFSQKIKIKKSPNIIVTKKPSINPGTKGIPS